MLYWYAQRFLRGTEGRHKLAARPKKYTDWPPGPAHAFDEALFDTAHDWAGGDGSGIPGAGHKTPYLLCDQGDEPLNGAASRARASREKLLDRGEDAVGLEALQSTRRHGLFYRGAAALPGNGVYRGTDP